MSMLQFGDYAPDQPSINAEVLRRAENCLFINGAYRPLPGYAEAVEIDAIAPTLSIVQCASFTLASQESLTIVILQDTGTISIGAISRNNLTIIPLDSLSVDINPSHRWNMIKYGTKVLIASRANPLIVIEFGHPYTANSISVVDVAVTGELITTVRDRIVHAGDPNHPFRIRFSGINEVTFDPAASLNPGGFQDIPDTGAVTAVTGGEVGLVFTETGIDRLIETGNDAVYQRDNISNAVGCRESGWAYRVGGDVYFHSYAGFKRITREGMIDDIGHGRIDLWLDQRSEAVQQSVFHWNDLTVLLFYQVGGRTLAYNYLEDRFTTIEAAVDINWRGWTRSLVPALTMDDPSIDTVKIDSSEVAQSRISDLRWGGGDERFVEYYTEDGKLFQRQVGYGPEYQQISGITILETGELYATSWLESQQDERDYQRRGAIPPTARIFSNEGRLVGDLTSPLGNEYQLDARMAVATRDTATQAPWQYGEDCKVLLPPFDALCPWMESGRYMAIRVQLDGPWSYVTGVDVALEEDGSGPNT